MTSFTFDGAKGFDANLDAFLDYMDADDAEMGTILRAHISKLKGAADDARRAARTEFNAGVKSALDDLLNAKEEEAGE